MSTLFVVATPIGNLGDISTRAVEILRTVDLIAAEDTRHSKRLLQHLGIDTALISYHDHNEAEATTRLIRELQAGRQVALISDAGTPLVSDPGFALVRQAIVAGIPVSPIPGPSALVSALSVAGLPVDRFCFEGFLPAKPIQRLARLKDLCAEPRTLVFFEAPHRIRDLARDLVATFGEDRPVTLARELTKQFEQVWHGAVGQAHVQLEAGTIREKGEFVVVVGGNPNSSANLDEVRLMQILLAELSPSSAAGIASQILGVSRKHLYDVALSLKNR